MRICKFALHSMNTRYGTMSENKGKAGKKKKKKRGKAVTKKVPILHFTSCRLKKLETLRMPPFERYRSPYQPLSSNMGASFVHCRLLAAFLSPMLSGGSRQSNLTNMSISRHSFGVHFPLPLSREQSAFALNGCYQGSQIRSDDRLRIPLVRVGGSGGSGRC